LNVRVTVLVAVVSLLLASQAIPSSVAVTSKVPSLAVGLALTIIPPKLPADNGTYPAVVVSLVDSNGLPSAALTPLTVFLTSSSTNIASVPDIVTIPAGSEYVVVNAVTTPTPGSTSITASSHGLESAFATLTTAIPSGFPSILKVFVSPTTFLRRADTGTVRVELVDSAGFPSKAITPVTALLSSSNASVARLNQGSLTITPGEIYATGSFDTSANSGQAVITASSTGYGSRPAFVTVVSPKYCTGSCGSSKLLLRLLPGTLPTDGLTYSALEVGLATSLGEPAVSSSDTIVQLFSDESDIISVPTLVTIPAGNISVLVPLTTSSLQGQSSITVTSSSLLPGNVTVTTVIPAPSKLAAYVAPMTPSGSSTFQLASSRPILVIQLQDSNGNPARARVLTNITVTSSNSSMMSLPLHLSIKVVKVGQSYVGQDYVRTLLNASGSGLSVLTASSQGLLSSQVNLQLAQSPLIVTLSPSVSGATPYGSSTMYTNSTAVMTLSISFLGQPVQNLTVQWTATLGSISPTKTTAISSKTASTTFTPIISGLVCKVVTVGPCYLGTANITASFSSIQTGHISKSYLVGIYLPPPPPVRPPWYKTYWYYIVAAVVVVLVAGFYLFRLRRKKQRAEIEAGFEVV
jgi:hypothetical protein